MRPRSPSGAFAIALKDVKLHLLISATLLIHVLLAYISCAWGGSHLYHLLAMSVIVALEATDLQKPIPGSSLDLPDVGY